MLNFLIPGHEEALVIDKIILDLNGTIAIDGELLPGVAERIAALRDSLKFYLFTGDTHGNAGRIAEHLGVEVRVTKSAQDKADEAIKLGADTAAAIGNGRIARSS
jgi:soluble P-type ATPase